MLSVYSLLDEASDVDHSGGERLPALSISFLFSFPGQNHLQQKEIYWLKSLKENSKQKENNFKQKWLWLSYWHLQIEKLYVSSKHSFDKSSYNALLCAEFKAMARIKSGQTIEPLCRQTRSTFYTLFPAYLTFNNKWFSSKLKCRPNIYSQHWKSNPCLHRLIFAIWTKFRAKRQKRWVDALNWITGKLKVLYYSKFPLPVFSNNNVGL